MTEKILKAPYESRDTPLILGTIKIPCYVLEDGTAVISGRGIQDAIGIPKTSSGVALLRFLKSKPINKHLPSDLFYSFQSPLKFIRLKAGGAQPLTNGYKATLLIDLCYALIDLKNAGIALTPRQQQLVAQAEIITRAFSKAAIVLAIYKLTGYLDTQVAGVINEILNKFLLDEAKKYRITYPLDLYKEWFRLNDWEWKLSSAQKNQVY